MQLIYRNIFKNINRNVLHTITLLICWCVFLFIGIYTALRVNVQSLLMMRESLMTSTSIFGLACVALFPLLLSVVAFRSGRFLLLVTTVCIKAYAFAFTCCCIYSIFSDAGWMMRWLLVFTDSILLIALMYYWIRNTLQPPANAVRGAGGYLILSSLMIAVDCCFISPLIITLLRYTM